MRRHERGDQPEVRRHRLRRADAPRLPHGLLGDSRLTAPGSGSLRERVAREAQHAAGNLAVQGIVQREPATAARPKPEHLTWERANKIVLESEFVKPFIAEKVRRGLKIKGEISVERPAEFAEGFAEYASHRRNPEGVRESETHAYEDRGKIHIHEERGDTGTAIHETLHLYADYRWKAHAGFHAGEGVTEWFAKKVCAAVGISHGGAYPTQFMEAQRLADAAGLEALGKAYFQGDTDGLKAAVDAKFPSKAGSTYERWLGMMKAGEMPTGLLH